MTAVLPEADLDALLAALLPPCEFIDTTFGEQHCTQPSEAVVTVRCRADGTFREAFCGEHVRATVSGEYVLRCNHCDRVVVLVGVDR